MNAEQSDPHKEEIEGIEEPNDSITWGEYPIDTLLIRNETRTVHDVLRRIQQGSYVMNPDFQRDFIWKEDKQSKLIESVLMRIPIPVFYLAEDQQGRMIVVDGLQRLSTFRDFVHGDEKNKKLKLRLPHRDDLNKKSFADLSPKLQNRIEDSQLILYVMDAKVPERARLDIFERVNGGVALTRQQMRNCMFMGQATLFLKEEAQSRLFLQATGKSLNENSMRDREFVNRFCAFQLLPIEDYRDMDEFLAEALKKMNALASEELQNLSTQLRLSLQNNYLLFEKHSFRKHAEGQENRSVINAAIWDVMSVGMSRYPATLVSEKADALKLSFYKLLKNNEFDEAVTRGTNQVKNVLTRFKLANRMFEEVFCADKT